MNPERRELADLFASYLRGTLQKDCDVASWERFRQSRDSTVLNAFQILCDQLDDVGFDLHLYEKEEWDYIERVRLALLGNANIVRRKSQQLDWRNVLSAIGFFTFLLIAIFSGIGYHLLLVTVFLGLATMVVLRFFPKLHAHESPYDNIVCPFASFSDLKTAHDNANEFRKIRYQKGSHKSEPLVSRLIWRLAAGVFLLTMSPIVLLVLMFPDTEPRYRATTG